MASYLYRLLANIYCVCGCVNYLKKKLCIYGFLWLLYTSMNRLAPYVMVIDNQCYNMSVHISLLGIAILYVLNM